MLPQALLRFSYHVEGNQIVPHYLGARDEGWLASLLEEYARFEAQKQADWLERLRAPLPMRAPRGKLKLTAYVLDAWCAERAPSALPSREVRATTFRLAAARLGAPRAELLATAASALGVSASDVEQALFADLPLERRVGRVPEELTVRALASRVNWAIVSSMLRRAVSVRLAVAGQEQARVLIRQARWMGLLCRASALDVSGAALLLEVSGPFALFRHGAAYGRALSALLPALSRCDVFELSAACVLARDASPLSFALRAGELEVEQRPWVLRESRVRTQFERALRRATADWEVHCDPIPPAADASGAFADFELIQRQSGRRVLLEIVGFWTPRFLRQKLERLRAAGWEQYVLCVDRSRACGDQELPDDSWLIGYSKRIDVQAVLRLIERGEPAPASEAARNR